MADPYEIYGFRKRYTECQQNPQKQQKSTTTATPQQRHRKSFDLVRKSSLAGRSVEMLHLPQEIRRIPEIYRNLRNAVENIETPIR